MHHNKTLIFFITFLMIVPTSQQSAYQVLRGLGAAIFRNTSNFGIKNAPHKSVFGQNISQARPLKSIAVSHQSDASFDQAEIDTIYRDIDQEYFQWVDSIVPKATPESVKSIDSVISCIKPVREYVDVVPDDLPTALELSNNKVMMSAREATMLGLYEATKVLPKDSEPIIAKSNVSASSTGWLEYIMSYFVSNTKNNNEINASSEVKTNRSSSIYRPANVHVDLNNKHRQSKASRNKFNYINPISVPYEVALESYQEADKKAAEYHARTPIKREYTGLFQEPTVQVANNVAVAPAAKRKHYQRPVQRENIQFYKVEEPDDESYTQSSFAQSSIASSACSIEEVQAEFDMPSVISRENSGL